MKIISIINQKGGVGKTTLAVNLGVALSERGKKILLIDLDPQGNLTYSFGITPNGGTISDVLQGSKTIQAILTQAETVTLAPSSVSLADVEVSLVSKIGREGILKDRLKTVTGFDYILIDCPPSLSVLTINALNASDEVIIPLQLEVLSMQGLGQLLATIKEVRQVLNKNLKIRGIIPSMFDGRRKLSEEVLKEIAGNVKERIFKTSIRECVKIAEAPSFAKSVMAYAPSSNGAEDFRNLAKEFIKEG